LTLTPRQRIVVQRELVSIRLAASNSPFDTLRAAPELDSISKDFLYAGIDTCALDGLCGTACPVGINTGDYIKSLRTEAVTNEKPAIWLADNFSLVEKSLGVGVMLGHATEKFIGANGVTSVIKVAEKISNSTLPKWNNSIPSHTRLRTERRAGAVEAQFIYFPSCISRQLGVPGFKYQVSGSPMSLGDALVTVADRANINLSIPENVAGYCCGMPFSSKGYTAAYKATLHKTLLEFWEWSERGKYPVIMDTTSCTHTLRTCKDDLSEEDKEIWNQLTIFDGIEFLHDQVLPKLKLYPVNEDVILHPNCSLRRLGLDGKMLSIAKQCARSAHVPLNLGCCAFAGDRGLLHPELTASATKKETAEVNIRNYDGYYSSNITCEIGMSEATEKDYVSIVYLVEKASRVK